MSKFNITKIDLLQIDVEGFDFEVIKMFRINETKPKVLCFENSHLTKDDFNNCVEHLQNNNYVVRSIKADSIAMLRPIDGFEFFFESD